MLESLFTFDKKKLTVTAKDYQQKTYSFSLDFYETYMLPTVNFLNDFLDSKRKEIEEISNHILATNKSNGKSIKSQENNESFVYNSGDITDLNLSQLHDKLVGANPPFIKKPKDIRLFKKIFSGEKITNPVVWMGTNYELHFFIKLLIDKIEKCSHFAVAVKCFNDKDNNKINYESLRTATRKPSKERANLLTAFVSTI